MGQTDNSYLEDKVMLRANNLPDEKSIAVLDCFAGRGTIWKRVQAIRFDKVIRTMPIEIKAGKNKSLNIPINNIRYLKSGNLNIFNVIDLDAYGIPFEQLKIIIDREWHGRIFATIIFSIMGRLNKEMLIEIGFTKKQIEKAPVLCSRNGIRKALEWLASKGVNKVTTRQNIGRSKNYIFFDL